MKYREEVYDLVVNDRTLRVITYIEEKIFLFYVFKILCLYEQMKDEKLFLSILLNVIYLRIS